MPQQQRQFDYDRGAQLAALRALSIPDGVARDGSGVTAGTALAVLRAIDDRIGSRPKKEPGRSQWTGETWVDQVTIGKQVGKSARTVAKAVQVLESMRLLNVLDTRRGGARRLVISIDWGTVFGDAVFQDPTFLVEWGVLPGDGPKNEEPRTTNWGGFNSEVNIFNSEVTSEFNSEATSELIRKPLPNSLYRLSTKISPTLSGVGGWEGIRSSKETTNEEPATTNAVMIRTIDPNEDRLTDRLVNLGVGSARATVQEALRIGYTAEAIDAVIDRYESSALVDPDRGETVFAWWPGSLVGRLRDVDARFARPECGKWGPRSAIWTALELRLKNGGLSADPRGGSTNQLAKRREVIRGLNRDQVIQILGAIETGHELAERARKCLEWVQRAWKPEMVVPTPPQAVREFLALVDVEAILGGTL